MAMKPCERVELDFIDSAPFRFVSTVDLSEPHGLGATRVVDMRGGITGDEEYLAWEPHVHMAFRFNEASSGSIAAFAEDYRLEPTAAGCRLTWVMAMKPQGVAALVGMSLGRPVMSWLFGEIPVQPA
jgi:carbon monoxide dehydrogenase subunit G